MFTRNVFIVQYLVLGCYERIGFRHVELWRGKLARELMQNFRQINLIGLRGCFPVAHCDIIAKPSDLPECFVSITTTVH